MLHRIVLLALLVAAPAAAKAQELQISTLTGGGGFNGQASGMTVHGAIGWLAPPSGQAGPSQGGSYAVESGFFGALGSIITRNGADAHWLELAQWIRPVRGLASSSSNRWEREVAGLVPYQDDWIP